MEDQDRQDLLNYLEEAITFWRNELSKARASSKEVDELKASCYIDAYNSMKLYVACNVPNQEESETKTAHS